MGSGFRLIMISAMYENGGNTTQRFLDGHEELVAYPFESQPGSKYVQDYMASTYPLKYRWPVFPLDQSVADDYETIIDEEAKVRIKTPQSSKFRDYPMDITDKDRKEKFIAHMAGKPRTRANLIEAFFRASGEAWKDRKVSGKEKAWVGYSPIIVVDADKILRDMPAANVIQVVRNPWSAYGDTKKRAVPLSIPHYMTGWCQNQMSALTFREQFPDRMHIVRFEDIVINPKKTLTELLSKMDIGTSDALNQPSWNGTPMTQVYPWGTVRTPTPEANLATANELSDAEKKEIAERTSTLLDIFGYREFLKGSQQRIAA